MSKGIADFISALHIFARYTAETYCFSAEHDIIYICVSANDLPEDSEDGHQLTSLGWFVSSESHTWAKFVQKGTTL